MSWAIYLIMTALEGGHTSADFFVVPVLLFGPPVALLIFGIATGWAFRGFQVNNHSVKEREPPRKFPPRILLGAGVTGSAFGAVDENAVHLPFIDAHQQNPAVPAEKVNHVRAGVGHLR
jgi:hypothetical protein